MPDTQETQPPAAPVRLSARERLRLRDEGLPVPPPPPLPPVPSLKAAKAVPEAPAAPKAPVLPPRPEPGAGAAKIAAKIAAKKAEKEAKDAAQAKVNEAAVQAALKTAVVPPTAPFEVDAPNKADGELVIVRQRDGADYDQQKQEGNTATEFNPGVGAGGRFVDIITPIYRDLKAVTAFAIFATLKKFGTERLGWRMEPGNAMVNVVRNRMVHDFMQTDTPWCLFLDDDMLPPIGNAGWFYKLTGTQKSIPQRLAERHFLERLLSHNRPIVSATCFGRSPGAKPVFGAAFTDVLAVRKARDLSQDTLISTPWAGTGCLLVHRSVFEAIQKKFPELQMNTQAAGYEWDYFRPATQNGVPVGEDAAFGLRATAAGFPTIVDTGCQVLHVGNCAYGPHNTFG